MQMKGVTGKSVTGQEKMNEKALEAFSRYMEKKYGQ